MTSIIVNYGQDGRHRVEFRLSDEGQLEGRYLPGSDGIGSTTEWEPRNPDGTDPENVEVIGAINSVLSIYEQAARS